MDISKKTSFAANMAGAIDWLANVNQTQTGWQLPCIVEEVDDRDGFVTVSFQVTDTPLPLQKITIPIFGWRYIRYPIQKGDAGVTLSIDTNLDQLAGLSGGGITTMTPNGNLGPTLAFMPIMQQSMKKTDDPKAVLVVGPNGAIIRDDDKNSVVTINKDGISLVCHDVKVTITKDQIEMKNGTQDMTMTSSKTTIQCGSNKVTVSSGSVNLSGTVIINGHEFLSHVHAGVTSGSDASGGVV